MAKTTIIAPNLETPAPGTRDATGSGRLPDTLVFEQLHRLAVCAAIGAGLWTYGLVMDTIVRPLTVGARIPTPSVSVELVAIVASLLMFFYVRCASHAPERKAEPGLGSDVRNAGGWPVVT